MNKAFKYAFRCDNLSNGVKCLNKLVIESETVQKHRGFFSKFGLGPTDQAQVQLQAQSFPLPEFLTSINKNLEYLRGYGTINIVSSQRRQTRSMPLT